MVAPDGSSLVSLLSMSYGRPQARRGYSPSDCNLTTYRPSRASIRGDDWRIPDHALPGRSVRAIRGRIEREAFDYDGVESHTTEDGESIG